MQRQQQQHRGDDDSALVRDSRAAAESLTQALQKSPSIDAAAASQIKTLVGREFEDMLLREREALRDDHLRQALHGHQQRESKLRDAASFAEGERQLLISQLNDAIRQASEATYERDQIATEFAALEECFNKTVALHAHESVRIAQHTGSASHTLSHKPVHALDLGSGAGFPSWDEEHVRGLQRSSATSIAALREVRAERDSWRERAERAEGECTSTKNILRELRSHCVYLESQLTNPGTSARKNPPPPAETRGESFGGWDGLPTAPIRQPPPPRMPVPAIPSSIRHHSIVEGSPWWVKDSRSGTRPNETLPAGRHTEPASSGRLEDLQRTINVFESGSNSGRGGSGSREMEQQSAPSQRFQTSAGLPGEPPRKDLDALLLRSLNL